MPSTASAQPGPMVTTSRPPTAGPITISAFSGTASTRFACLSWSRGTSWGSTPAIAGIPAAVDVPLSAASAARCQISRGAGDHERGHRERAEPGTHVGRLDDEGPTEPVGQHAAGEQEHDHRDAVGREDRAQCRGRPADLEDGEGQGDAGHRGAGLVDQPGQPVVAEVRLAQRRQRRGSLMTGHRHLERGDLRLTWTVPVVRGGLAASCISAEASSTSASTLAQASGATHISASERRPWCAASRADHRRSSSWPIARTCCAWSFRGCAFRPRTSVPGVPVALGDAAPDGLLAVRDDLAGLREHAQVVRRVGLRRAELAGELGGAHRRPGEDREDLQPERVGGRPQRGGLVAGHRTSKDMFGG